MKTSRKTWKVIIKIGDKLHKLSRNCDWRAWNQNSAAGLEIRWSRHVFFISIRNFFPQSLFYYFSVLFENTFEVLFIQYFYIVRCTVKMRSFAKYYHRMFVESNVQLSHVIFFRSTHLQISKCAVNINIHKIIFLFLTFFVCNRSA